MDDRVARQAVDFNIPFITQALSPFGQGSAFALRGNQLLASCYVERVCLTIDELIFPATDRFLPYIKMKEEKKAQFEVWLGQLLDIKDTALALNELCLSDIYTREAIYFNKPTLGQRATQYWLTHWPYPNALLFNMALGLHELSVAVASASLDEESAGSIKLPNPHRYFYQDLVASQAGFLKLAERLQSSSFESLGKDNQKTGAFLLKKWIEDFFLNEAALTRVLDMLLAEFPEEKDQRADLIATVQEFHQQNTWFQAFFKPNYLPLTYSWLNAYPELAHET